MLSIRTWQKIPKKYFHRPLESLKNSIKTTLKRLQVNLERNEEWLKTFAQRRKSSLKSHGVGFVCEWWNKVRRKEHTPYDKPPSCPYHCFAASGIGGTEWIKGNMKSQSYQNEPAGTGQQVMDEEGKMDEFCSNEFWPKPHLKFREKWNLPIQKKVFCTFSSRWLQEKFEEWGKWCFLPFINFTLMDTPPPKRQKNTPLPTFSKHAKHIVTTVDTSFTFYFIKCSFLDRHISASFLFYIQNSVQLLGWVMTCWHHLPTTPKKTKNTASRS